jgi:uncharacterized protein YndB with AHSA1/START domain
MADRDGVLGRLGAEDGKGIVWLEGRADAEVDRVWSALTEPGRLAEWYGEIEGELRLDGEFHALLHASGWEGTRRVAACEPRRRLLVVPRDGADADADSTEVTLRPVDGGRTVVAVEQRGLPLDLVWAYGAGLQIHVEDLFAHHAGGGRADARTRFGELEASYRELAADLTAG